MVIYSNEPDLENSHNYEVIMYLIVRESLLDKMGSGKIGAQCGHAVQLVMSHFYTKEVDSTMALRMASWLNTDYPKIVLKADEKEWEKLKEHAELYCFVVRDAGNTQVDPGTETVIALWPSLKSERPKLLSRLQLLK